MGSIPELVAAWSSRSAWRSRRISRKVKAMRRGASCLCALLLAGALAACGRVQEEVSDTSGGGDATGAAGAGAGGRAGPAAAGQGGFGESNAGMTITGRVIDSWRRPVAGCPVALGDATTLTSAEGEFRFEQVTAPYDVAFTVPEAPNTGLGPQLWLYTGLTRPDPTLQFACLATRRHWSRSSSSRQFGINHRARHSDSSHPGRPGR